MNKPLDPPAFASRELFARALCHFINHELPQLHKKVPSNLQVSRDTPLFDDGLIDSMGILYLINFVEQATGQTIPQQKIVMKHFQTVTAIADAFWMQPATP